MIPSEFKRSWRSTALIGLGIMFAAGPAVPMNASPVAPMHVKSESGGESIAPAIVQASSALCQWAWEMLPESAELDSRVGALLASAAAETDPAIWEQAQPMSALMEASLRIAGRNRAGLAASIRELGWSAPTEALRVTAVRFELRLLESIVGASPSITGHDSHVEAGSLSPRDLALGRIHEIFTTGEIHWPDGPSQGCRIRERTATRLATLGVGQPFPRFLARDTAGNEVRSSLLSGRVTILRFWEESSPASMLAHEADARLARRFWDAPVVLLGSTHSQDRSGYLDLIDSRSFAGTQLFDGPISTVLEDELAKAGAALAHGAGLSSTVGIFEAWSMPTAGSLFVIDETGVIRGRDLPIDEMEHLVAELVAERRARLRARSEGRFIVGSTR